MGKTYRNKKRRDPNHCKRGHKLTGDNVYVTPDGERRCRECGLIRDRQYRRNKNRLLALARELDDGEI